MIISRSNALLFFFVGLIFNLGISTAIANQSPAATMIQGIVTEVIDVASYTYAEVKTEEGSTVWAAAPTTSIKEGEQIRFATNMPMQDFHSKSIDRRFPIIYFTSRFVTDANKRFVTKKPASHPKVKVKKTVLKGIKKAEGGQTIAEIMAKKDSLTGKVVKVRGQVTRFSAEVMGKNWLHIQDSSTGSDLTITTQDTVAIGDVVVMTGKLALDKDFGYGYLYPIILEEAHSVK